MAGLVHNRGDDEWIGHRVGPRVGLVHEITLSAFVKRLARPQSTSGTDAARPRVASPRRSPSKRCPGAPFASGLPEVSPGAAEARSPLDLRRPFEGNAELAREGRQSVG